MQLHQTLLGHARQMRTDMVRYWQVGWHRGHRSDSNKLIALRKDDIYTIEMRKHPKACILSGRVLASAKIDALFVSEVETASKPERLQSTALITLYQALSYIFFVNHRIDFCGMLQFLQFMIHLSQNCSFVSPRLVLRLAPEVLSRVAPTARQMCFFFFGNRIPHSRSASRTAIWSLRSATF